MNFQIFSTLRVKKKANYVLARRYAEKTVKKHRKAVQRWGIMADWNNEYYTTMDKKYEVNQLEVFYQMFSKVRRIFSRM